MVENKQYITHLKENGRVMISEDVIATIVEHTLTDVEGVVKGGADVVGKKSWGKGVRITIADDNSLIIGCNIIVGYGVKISQVVQEVQKKVKYVLEKTLDIKFKSINVFVKGIKSV